MGTRNRTWFFLAVSVFLSSSLKANFSEAAGNVSSSRSLSGNQTMTSKGGNFELGFFSPGKSQKYYIGIWYKKVSQPTVVWVANRETPLHDTSSQLRISEDGNLVLQNQSNILIWSTNSPRRTSNSVAVLLDNGNLVLRDRSNSSVVFWQSFDHPTHTWLPEGRFGLNKITGESQILTSWRNSDDPAPGPYTLELDPKGSTLFSMKWNGSQGYWSSGDWNGPSLSGVPAMNMPDSQNMLYSYNFIDNNREKYFTYFVNDPSAFARLVMDVSGQIKTLIWSEQSKEWILFWSQSKDQCDVYSLCGDFGSCNRQRFPLCTCLQGFGPASSKDWNLSDWSGGCVRKTPLLCGSNTYSNREKDRFWIMQDVQLAPVTPRPLTVRSADDCESACLKDCSCTAYAYGSSGCSIWNGGLQNLRQASTGDNDRGNLYLRLAASDMPVSSGKKKLTIGAIMGAVLGVIIVAMGIVSILIWRRQRMKTTKESVQGSLIRFSYRDLQSATMNFTEKLGEGSFGSVFRGILPDSTVIAVKKLEGLRQGEKQFWAEVSTIGAIQHVNLIRLRGFCPRGNTKLLVYDHMPNGSLNSYLLGKTDNVLDWKTRYQIALGTARGLAYLHDECRNCIIHCDVKPENVLLDAKFCPKLSDFGMAKLFDRYKSRVLTTMRGTLGYLAPEWVSGVAITVKADVYSYGMMLFEVISGNRNARQSEDGEVDFFPFFAASKTKEGDVLCLLDKRLDGNTDMEELERACRVASWCIQEEESCRPSMREVVQALEGVRQIKVCEVPMFLRRLAEHQGSSSF